MSANRILLVDDDPIIRRGVEKILTAEGFSVLSVDNGNEAMRSIQESIPDLMILDLSLINDSVFNGITDGFSLFHWIKYSLKDARFPVIIFTVDNSPSVDRHAAQCGAYAVVRKTDSFAQLVQVVRNALADGESERLAKEFLQLGQTEA